MYGGTLCAKIKGINFCTVEVTLPAALYTILYIFVPWFKLSFSYMGFFWYPLYVYDDVVTFLAIIFYIYWLQKKNI